MKRRSLIVGLGSLTAGNRAGFAQAGVPTVGVLVPDEPDEFTAQLASALQQFGLSPGKNVRFAVRSAQGNSALLAELAAELVRLKVNLIVARLTPAALAASRATQTIPIVMAGAGDPLETGLVDSLSHPGRNVTGVAGLAATLAGKLVEIIHDMLPGAHHIAVLANFTDTFTKPFTREISLAANAMSMEANVTMVRGGEDLAKVFEQVMSTRPQAAIVQPSLPRRAAALLALAHHLPTFSPVASFAAEGGLVAYSSNTVEIFQQTARYVDSILKGAMPADLPVTQPTKFDLTINMRTATAIGLTIPPTVMALADNVLQ